MNYVYIVLIGILVLSFITGVVITIIELSKKKKEEKKKNKENQIVVEENPNNIIENEIVARVEETTPVIESVQNIESTITVIQTEVPVENTGDSYDINPSDIPVIDESMIPPESITIDNTEVPTQVVVSTEVQTQPIVSTETPTQATVISTEAPTSILKSDDCEVLDFDDANEVEEDDFLVPKVIQVLDEDVVL